MLSRFPRTTQFIANPFNIHLSSQLCFYWLHNGSRQALTSQSTGEGETKNDHGSFWSGMLLELLDFRQRKCHNHNSADNNAEAVARATVWSHHSRILPVKHLQSVIWVMNETPIRLKYLLWGNFSSTLGFSIWPRCWEPILVARRLVPRPLVWPAFYVDLRRDNMEALIEIVFPYVFQLLYLKPSHGASGLAGSTIGNSSSPNVTF